MTQPKTKVLIVDDEPDARNLLQQLLEKYDCLEITGLAKNAIQAKEMILQDFPDVMFLDVEMPTKTGIELLEELNQTGRVPRVVFTTAYDKYAIKAIKQAAVDYLLKPISVDELHTTVMRLMADSSNPLQDKLASFLHYNHPDNKLRINTRTGYLLINVNEIIYCRAAANYTEIFLGKDKKEVATINLGKTTRLLEGNPQFKRVGRSLLVNTNYIYKIDRSKKTCTLEKGGEEVTIELPAKLVHVLDQYPT